MGLDSAIVSTFVLQIDAAAWAMWWAPTVPHVVSGVQRYEEVHRVLWAGVCLDSNN